SAVSCRMSRSSGWGAGAEAQPARRRRRALAFIPAMVRRRLGSSQRPALPIGPRMREVTVETLRGEVIRLGAVVTQTRVLHVTGARLHAPGSVLGSAEIRTL